MYHDFGMDLFESQIEIALCFMHETLMLLYLSLASSMYDSESHACIGLGSHFRPVYVYGPDGITLCCS